MRLEEKVARGLGMALGQRPWGAGAHARTRDGYELRSAVEPDPETWRGAEEPLCGPPPGGYRDPDYIREGAALSETGADAGA